MDRYPRAMAVFGDLQKSLQDLGFRLKETWSLGIGAIQVMAGRRQVAQIRYIAGDDRISLTVHPASGSIAILGGSGYVPLDQADRVEAVLDHVESLFRSWLVAHRKLPQAQFPTDVSLRAWLAGVSAVSLPGEPTARWATSSLASETLVRAARSQFADYQRTPALQLLGRARVHAPGLMPDGREADPALGFIHRSALAATDWKQARLDLAWEKENGLAYLLAPAATPAPAPAEVPEPEEAMAPRL